MFDSEHVLDKLRKLTDCVGNLLIGGKGGRRESVNMTVYQSIDFGGAYGTEL